MERLLAVTLQSLPLTSFAALATAKIWARWYAAMSEKTDFFIIMV